MHTQTHTTYTCAHGFNIGIQVIAHTHSHCRLSVCELRNDGALQ